MTKKENDILIKQIGLPIWELDYSKINDDFARNKYIEFADYSKKLLHEKFQKAFGISLEKRFEFDLQIPEGSYCWMTNLAEEEYHYIDNVTGKKLYIYINFKCNRLCNSVFEENKIQIYRLKAYNYYTPNIEKCKVKLYYELQKNESNNFGYDSLDDIKNDNIEKYLHQEKKQQKKELIT